MDTGKRLALVVLSAVERAYQEAKGTMAED
jgi:hypothetical protein